MLRFLGYVPMSKPTAIVYIIMVALLAAFWWISGEGAFIAVFLGGFLGWYFMYLDRIDMLRKHRDFTDEMMATINTMIDRQREINILDGERDGQS